MANILDAIMNILNDGTFMANRNKENTVNTVNQVGDPLEEFVKDAFAGSFGMEGEEREQSVNEVIIYGGNSSNPPDMIVGGEDSAAIEVKKSDSANSDLQLNSSLPHYRLRCEDSRITEKCKRIMAGEDKDIIYVVGSFKANSKEVKHLAFVYGQTYCAEETVYRRIDEVVRKKLVELTTEIQEIMPTAYKDEDSNELAKLKEIDPLGYCDLRVRGMYTYASPFRVFNEAIPRRGRNRTILAVIPTDIYEHFSNKKEFEDYLEKKEKMSVVDIEIDNPDGSESKISCKKILYKE